MQAIRRLTVALAAMTCWVPAAYGQTAAPNQRLWAEVNFGVVGSAAKAETFRFETIRYEEPLLLDASYPKPSSGMAFDVGGGMMITPLLGVGVNVARGAHQDPANLALVVPHPFHYDASANASGESIALDRQESAVHLEIAVAPKLAGDRIGIRIFGGPSFFRYHSQMVHDIVFDQQASENINDNVVTITDADIVDVDGSATGFHAGASFNYFFSRMIGAGVSARFSRATVTLDQEPMSELSQKIKVGGFTIGGGVRLRF